MMIYNSYVFKYLGSSLARERRGQDRPRSSIVHTLKKKSLQQKEQEEEGKKRKKVRHVPKE